MDRKGDLSKKNKIYKAVIFDMDGVIADNHHYHVIACIH